MTAPSKYDGKSEALEGTSGLPSDDSEAVLYSTDSSDSGKLTRAGAPTSTFWHIENLNPISGRFRHIASIGTDKVNQASQVMVSITERDAAGTPFYGDAPMEIFNVVPHDDGTVWVRAHVHSNSALRVRLNYIIFN